MATYKKNRIPRFTSKEEEADFWDRHSLAEFEDELEVIEEIAIKQPIEHELTVSLDAEILSRISSLSSRKGLPLSELVRRLLLAGLAEEEIPSPIG